MFKNLKATTGVVKNQGQKSEVIKWVVFVFIILYLLPKDLFISPGADIDASWKIALNLAWKEGLIWGKDIIFTYGPLGFLSTKLPVYTSKVLIVLFSIFISANGIYFIHTIFKKISNTYDLIFMSCLFFFTGEFLFTGEFPFMYTAITLYFYFLFNAFLFLQKNRILNLGIASIICLITFYIKVNAGLILNVVLLFFLSFIFFKKTVSRKVTLLISIGHYFLLWALSFVLQTDFLSYIVNSFPIINSYNDAMVFLSRDFFYLIYILVVISVIAIAYLSSLKKLFKSQFEIFLLFNILFFVFITFKQGFVRADDFHTIIFIEGISFIILLIYLFSEITTIKTNIYYGVIVIGIFSISNLRDYRASSFKTNTGLNHLLAKDNLNDKKQRALPQRIIKDIGSQTVDVLGYETSFIYHNHLNYNPRPIIQSYSVYDPKLIELNYHKYDSKTSPDYVLYNFGSIDERHPFWDESLIYLPLLQNYTVFDTAFVETFTPLLVFKKNEERKRILEKKVILDTIINFNSPITIPKSDNLIYLSIESDYTFAGKIRRLLYQPSLSLIDLQYEDNSKSEYTLVLPVMESGVPINRKVLTAHDAYTFFTSLGKKNSIATSFKLKGNPLWIQDSFHIKFIEYSFN